MHFFVKHRVHWKKVITYFLKTPFFPISANLAVFCRSVTRLQSLCGVGCGRFCTQNRMCKRALRAHILAKVLRKLPAVQFECQSCHCQLPNVPHWIQPKETSERNRSWQDNTQYQSTLSRLWDAGMEPFGMMCDEWSARKKPNLMIFVKALPFSIPGAQCEMPNARESIEIHSSSTNVPDCFKVRHGNWSFRGMIKMKTWILGV